MRPFNLKRRPSPNSLRALGLNLGLRLELYDQMQWPENDVGHVPRQQSTGPDDTVSPEAKRGAPKGDPKGRTRGVSRKAMIVQWTISPANGFTRDGEP